MTKIIRLPAVMERTGLPRSTLYAYVAQKQFPSPLKISERSVGWLESDVDEWIQSRIVSSQKQGQ